MHYNYKQYFNFRPNQIEPNHWIQNNFGWDKNQITYSFSPWRMVWSLSLSLSLHWQICFFVPRQLLLSSLHLRFKIQTKDQNWRLSLLLSYVFFLPSFPWIWISQSDLIRSRFRGREGVRFLDWLICCYDGEWEWDREYRWGEATY